MAWANFVEEANVWTWTSLKWARGFVLPENNIENADSEATRSHQDISDSLITAPGFLSQLKSGRTSAPRLPDKTGANQRDTCYLRFDEDFGGAGGGDRSTGMNCCVSQASMIADCRVPL